MKTKIQKGFTLVEVLIAIITGLIVLLAAGMVTVTGHRTWNEAWKKVNLQRDASYAMLRISSTIKAGKSAKVEGDGKALTIYRDADWVRFSLAPGTKNLNCQFEGKPETIINNKTEYLNFNVEGNTVGVDLKLKEDNLQTHFTSTVMMRNYGG